MDERCSIQTLMQHFL